MTKTPRFRAPGPAPRKRPADVVPPLSGPDAEQMAELGRLLIDAAPKGTLAKVFAVETHTRTRIEVWLPDTPVKSTTYANAEVERLGDVWPADVLHRLGLG